MPRKPPESIYRLSRVDARRLEDYVLEHYVTTGQTDIAFAQTAAKDLDLSGITQHHIAGAREVFGLKSNRDALREAARAGDSLNTRVTALEARVQGLLDAFAVFKRL